MPWDGNLFGYYTPPPAGPVMPSPTPQPAPSPSPVPTPQPGQGGHTPMQLAQMVQQLLGNNAGGAQGNHGAFGSGGSDGSGFGGGLFGSPNNYISMGPVLSGLLQAGTMAPGWAGIGMSGLQAALRGWNTANTDAVRQQRGIPSLDLGQVIGSLMGWNDYGNLSGNQTIANASQYKNPLNGQPVGISTGGLSYDSWGPFGLFGSQQPVGMLTPGEDSTKRAMVGLKEYLKQQQEQALYNAKNGYTTGQGIGGGYNGGGYQAGYGGYGGGYVGGGAGGTTTDSLSGLRGGGV